MPRLWTLRLAALALVPVLASPLLAQGTGAPALTDALPSAPAPATVRVGIDTSEGRIVLALETERAPVTSANFLRYVDGKKLN